MEKSRTILTKFRSNSALFKRIYDRTMEPVCDRHHITRMELDILLFLANNPGYDTARDIVEQKRFTKSHVSSALHLLEEKGFLTRALHPGNRKNVHLSLLPASEHIVRAGQAAQREVFQLAFGTLSPQEIQLLEEISDKINAAVKAALT